MAVKQLLLLLCAGAFNLTLGQSIENDRYLIRRSENGALSVATKPSGAPLFKDLRLSGEGGTARVLAVEDKAFGRGQGLEISYADGGRDLVILFGGQPF